MKFNFWQWLGLILLVLGVVVLFRNKTGDGTDDSVLPPNTGNNATTMTTTTTQPG